MMEAFEDCGEQDLGQDFFFESDPNSLKRILDNRELSPRSVLAMRLSSKLVQPTVSPVKGAPKMVRDHPERYDFFQSKRGDVFWRPKTPKSCRKEESSAFQQPQQPVRQRALGKGVVNALPQRMQPKKDTIDPIRVTMSSRKPLNNHGAADNKNKGRRSCMPQIVVLPPPRLSISERKAVPGLDNIPNRIHKTVAPSARKELDFSEDHEDKENDDDSIFAKPLPLAIKEAKCNKEEKNSLAKMILLRESLAGLPRASLSGLFRQSLSIAELDRMFADDSTQSFEDFERRLKTPGKSKAPSKLKAFTPKYEKDHEVSVGKTPKLNESLDSEEVKSNTSNSVKIDSEQNSNQSAPPSSNQATLTTEVKEAVENGEQSTCVPTDEDVVKVELFEYDIDGSFADDEEIERKLLQRSMSMMNLSTVCAENEEEESEEKIVLLAKSSSLTDLAGVEPDSNFLESAVEALEEHRQEQAMIEKQIQALMEKSLQRREKFRAVWGVSPKSINQKRDLKTVIHVQNVSFSEDRGNDEAKEPDFDEVPSEEIEDDIFGTKTPVKQLCSKDDEDNAPPVDSQIFQELIDANFPEQNILYAVHNFTGIDVTTLGVASLDDISIDPMNGNCNIDAPVEKSEDDMDIEETDEATPPQSLFQAARNYMNEENDKKPQRKTVRFLNATPVKHAVEGDENNSMDEDSPSEVTVTVMKNCSIVHTPIPKHHNFRMSQTSPENEEEFLAQYEKTPPLPTPMAMRNISQKAQESLAQLYETPQFQPKVLDFTLDDTDES